jgi:UrcA family protein
MITKLSFAALVTIIAATSTASARDNVSRNGDEYVMRFQKIDASNPAHRARVIDRVEQVASRVCADDTVRIDRARCRQDFVRRALATIENADVRQAMLDTYEGATSAAVALADASAK